MIPIIRKQYRPDEPKKSEISYNKDRSGGINLYFKIHEPTCEFSKIEYFHNQSFRFPGDFDAHKI